MTLCDRGHDEICYDGRHCPACELIEDKDSEIATLRDRIIELQRENRQLEIQIAEE